MERRIWVVAGSVVVAGATGIVWAHHASEHRALPQVTHAAWASECGGCHVAYHPALLPARSWQGLVEQSSAHFGQDLGLDDRARTEIAAFLVANAGDRGAHEGARTLASSIPAAEAPRRITETRWFAEEHAAVQPSVWKRKAVGGPGNCPACHGRVAQGGFDPRDAAIPE